MNAFLCRWLLLGSLFCAVLSRAQDLPPFPLQDIVATMRSNLITTQITATKLDKSAYLDIVRGQVDYFARFQKEDGRIIDPFLQREFQYSTPCYAWAATALIVGRNETNRLDSACRALTAAMRELAEDKAADNHGDFFTFPVMQAYEQLRDRVSPLQRFEWRKLLRAIVPEKSYRDVLSAKRPEVHNWNVVALTGEFLRYQNGFTGTNFFASYLPRQRPYFTANGLYLDPHEPMAYDHFPRHFLAALLARGYDGPERGWLEELSRRGVWTSLLMQSPTGELPTGGRSAQHQWNEAEQCVTFEIWAARAQKEGDAVFAHACKRAAHLSLQSIRRWVRPSGELWIVKNRFDPGVRHGFENYSSHSQYNLLAASMLATAWLQADDTIPEGMTPAEMGGFVFQLPEHHKIFANAGGLYVEIETAADPHYNSTGLLRVHRTGVEPLIGPSDNAPAETEPLATGIAWKDGDEWQSLANLTGNKAGQVRLAVAKAWPGQVQFAVTYEPKTAAAEKVVENYDLVPSQVRVRAEVTGTTPELQVRFPAFVFDGRDDASITVKPTHETVDPARVQVDFAGSRQTWSMVSELASPLQRGGERIPVRNGFLEMITGEVKGRTAEYTLRPEKVAAEKK